MTIKTGWLARVTTFLVKMDSVNHAAYHEVHHWGVRSYNLPSIKTGNQLPLHASIHAESGWSVSSAHWRDLERPCVPYPFPPPQELQSEESL